MTAYDALLGTISKDGVQLELGSGLNFTGSGVTIVRNPATGKLDIAITSGGGGSSFPLTGNVSAANHKITLLANGGAGSQDAATVAQVEALIGAITTGAGLNSVTTVAASNVASLSGLAQTINGVTLNTDGMTVLLVAQTPSTQNGAWVVHSGAWTRPTWFPSGGDAAGAVIVVQRGSALFDTTWLCTANTGTAVIDTNALVFVEITEAGITVADGTTLQKTGLIYSVKPGGIAAASLAALSVTGPKLAAPAAAGAQLLWDGAQWLHVGTLSATLADASVTIQFGTASQYMWPSTVDSASARTLTFGNTGLAAGPMAGQAAVMSILFLRASYTSAITVKGLGGVTTLFTLPAALGKPVVARFYYDTTAADWALAGWDYLSAVAVA